jgi:hypothetical protein
MGILLLPTFIALFSRAIIQLSEERGSIPSLIKKAMTFEYIKRGLKHIHLPRISYLTSKGGVEMLTLYGIYWSNHCLLYLSMPSCSQIGSMILQSTFFTLTNVLKSCELVSIREIIESN